MTATKKPLRYYLAPAEHQALKILAARKGTTMRALVAAAIRRLINTRKGD